MAISDACKRELALSRSVAKRVSFHGAVGKGERGGDVETQSIIHRYIRPRYVSSLRCLRHFFFPLLCFRWRVEPSSGWPACTIAPQHLCDPSL